MGTVTGFVSVGSGIFKYGTSRESIASFMQLLYSWAKGSSLPASSFPFSVNRIFTLRRSEGSSIRSTSPCLLKRSTRPVTAGLSSCTRPAISLIPAPSCSNKSNRTKDWPRVIPNSKTGVIFPADLPGYSSQSKAPELLIFFHPNCFSFR